MQVGGGGIITYLSWELTNKTIRRRDISNITAQSFASAFSFSFFINVAYQQSL